VPSLILNRVERGRYLDSVVLMRLSRRLAALPGIEGAALMIGSPSNKLLLREAGLLATEGECETLPVLLRASGLRERFAPVGASIDDVHTLSPSMVLNLRYGYTRFTRRTSRPESRSRISPATIPA